MERFTSSDLMASSQRVTRYQKRQQMSRFPFLNMAPELRNMVYSYATTDPQQLADFFDKYYQRYLVAKSAKPRVWHNPQTNRMLANPTKKAPNIFLINKQIFSEASYLFYHSNRNVSFHHGMLEMNAISEFISPDVLQNMTSITITDRGHNQLIQLQQPGTMSLPASWNGYIKLLAQMGTILSANGHKLKKLTIDFSRDKRLPEHLEGCWHARHICGFRDQFLAAMDTFRGVRDVKLVTLIGFNPDHAAEMKRIMESKYVGFKNLPKEVRNIIFGYALGWENISNCIMGAISGRPEDTMKIRFPYPKLTTPTVLLMNKEYSAEALELLNEVKKTLTFCLPAKHDIAKEADMPKLSRFISRGTLKTVQNVEIEIKSRDWMQSIDVDFVTAFNAGDSQLQSFSITFVDDRMYQQYPVYPDPDIHHHLGKRLQKLRGLQVVKFSGTLPICYTDPLTTIMTGPRRTRRMPQLKGVQRGVVVDIDDAHHVAR